MEYNPLLDMPDALPKILYNAYYHGADILGESSNPCSICKESKHQGNGFMFYQDRWRIHFHGSDFGSCQKKVYLSKLNNLKLNNDGKYNFLMDGHMHEKTILDYMSNAPIKYDIHPCVNGKEIIKDYDNFLLVGHPDGFISEKIDRENLPIYIIECKAVGDTTYKQCQKNIISDNWYGQQQAYMAIYEDIEYCYLIVKHRATSDILMPFKIVRDKEYIQNRLNNLTAIADLLKYPNADIMIGKEHSNPKDLECTVCPFFNECWGKK